MQRGKTLLYLSLGVLALAVSLHTSSRTSVNQSGGVAVAEAADTDESAPVFLKTWGSYGGGPGEFDFTWDVACGPDGTVFVSDATQRIQRFASDGTYMDSWRLPSVVPTESYSFPTMMAFDDHGFLYACVNNGWVMKTTLDGALVTKWQVQGVNPFIFGIAVGADGNIFVSNNKSRNIQKFTPDGEFLLAWGSQGTGPGQFNGNNGLVGDRTGRIYAVDSGGDPGNRSVQVFDLYGNFLFEWGGAGDGPGQFASLIDVAIDPMGYVYVSDDLGHRIQKFTADGAFVAMWGSLGVGDGQFTFPAGIGTDLQGNVYVADSFNYRVQKFGEMPVQSLSTTWGRLKAEYR